ncbi:MAG: pentapeptide repeat-containing protein [Trichlorobacter sp.]|nr:pentapeptide repeat-containing protein [Trichlorobacter sp.]
MGVAFGAIHTRQPAPAPDLEVAKAPYANFLKATLSGACLKRMTATKADFADANLQNANLKGTDLSGANLKGACLSGVLGDGANLSKAALNWADLTWARMDDACFAGADMWSTNLAHADFAGADLKEARLSRARLLGTNLADAALEGADFSGADLRGCVPEDLSLRSNTPPRINQQEVDALVHCLNTRKSIFSARVMAWSQYGIKTSGFTETTHVRDTRDTPEWIEAFSIAGGRFQNN